MVSFTSQLNTQITINETVFNNVEYITQTDNINSTKYYENEIEELKEIFNDIIETIKKNKRHNIYTSSLNLNICLKC